MNKGIYISFSILVFAFASVLNAQKNVAPKPLFDNPVFHGAADPGIIWNKKKKEWSMFHTNRRATLNDGDKAYIYYFTHPGRTKLNPAKPNSFEAK
jgi:hypothetical protein